MQLLNSICGQRVCGAIGQGLAPLHRTGCAVAACGVAGRQSSGQLHLHLHLLHGLARDKRLGLVPECGLRQRLRKCHTKVDSQFTEAPSAQKQRTLPNSHAHAPLAAG